MVPPEKVAVWCWSRTSRTRSVAETMLTERVTRLRPTVEGSELNFCSKAFLKSETQESEVIAAVEGENRAVSSCPSPG